MHDTHNNLDNGSTEQLMQSAYFAVVPRQVTIAAQLFGVQSSILESGAKSLFDKATSIEAGKDTACWGRHKQSVIEQFCEYTRSRQQILPWHELVEHKARYDGKEGITPRTGNKPLATITRLQTQNLKLKEVRIQNGLSLEDLAQKTSLPELFLTALESGGWPTIAKSTAKILANALDISVGDLFLPLNIAIETESDAGAGANQPLKSRIFSNKFGWLAAAAIVLTMVIYIMSRYGIVNTKPTEADLINIAYFNNSHWFGTIAPTDKAIYISPDIEAFWTQGTYLYLRKNGSLAFNQVMPSNYIVMPYPETRWAYSNQQLTIAFDTLHYIFEIEHQDYPTTLITISNEGSFEMILNAVGDKIGG